jgi:hypothetical protein
MSSRCDVGAPPWVLVFAIAAACREPPVVDAARAVPARASNDRGPFCADVGATRACWDDARGDADCVAGICAQAREVPSGPLTADAWRCWGSGSERACEERRWNSGAFRCDHEECVQAKPRFPDDGEWECVEMDAVVFCRSTGLAAGLSAGPVDVGWLCGGRRASRNYERICVDLSPDRPGPEPDWRCVFHYYGGEIERACRRASGPRVGAPCADKASCPRGARCVGGHCMPPRPVPECWFDGDCGAGARCLWGTCGAAAP